MKTVMQCLTGVRDIGGGYFGCPNTGKNRAVFAKNRIPQVRAMLGGRPILSIHRTNAEREAVSLPVEKWTR